MDKLTLGQSLVCVEWEKANKHTEEKIKLRVLNCSQQQLLYLLFEEMNHSFPGRRKGSYNIIMSSASRPASIKLAITQNNTLLKRENLHIRRWLPGEVDTHLINVYLTLDQRLRRCPNVKQTLIQRILLTGTTVEYYVPYLSTQSGANDFTWLVTTQMTSRDLTFLCTYYQLQNVYVNYHCGI